MPDHAPRLPAGPSTGPDVTSKGSFEMKGITIDLAAAHALQSLTPRTVALIASIPDLDVPISSSDWTLGEAAVHLVFGARDYSEHARGAQRCYRINPADTTGNHDELASISQRDRPALDTELQLGIDAFLDATEGRTAEDLLPWSPSGPSRPNPPGWSLRPGYLFCPASSTGRPLRASLSATSSS